MPLPLPIRLLLAAVTLLAFGAVGQPQQSQHTTTTTTTTTTTVSHHLQPENTTTTTTTTTTSTTATATTTTSTTATPTTTTSTTATPTTTTTPTARPAASVVESGPCVILTPRVCVPAPTATTLTEPQMTALAALYWRTTQDVADAVKVAWCESRWDTTAVGDAGEHGLFQIIPRYWAPIKPEGSSFNPRVNTEWAHRIWSQTRSWKHWTCKP